MLKILALCSLLIYSVGVSQQKLQEFNVSGIQCTHIAQRVTPAAVERNPNRYVDSCVQWNGVVSTIADADLEGTKAWVVPIEGRWEYCGSTRLTITFAATGGADAASSRRFEPLFEYLCTHRADGIRGSDAVSFVGKILGVSRRPDPSHHGQPLDIVLIGITEMHKLDRETASRPTLWPANK